MNTFKNLTGVKYLYLSGCKTISSETSSRLRIHNRITSMMEAFWTNSLNPPNLQLIKSRKLWQIQPIGKSFHSWHVVRSDIFQNLFWNVTFRYFIFFGGLRKMWSFLFLRINHGEWLNNWVKDYNKEVHVSNFMK